MQTPSPVRVLCGPDHGDFLQKLEHRAGAVGVKSYSCQLTRDGGPRLVVLAPTSNASVTGVGRMSVVPTTTSGVAESPESGFSNSWGGHRLAAWFVVVEVVNAIPGYQISDFSVRTR